MPNKDTPGYEKFICARELVMGYLYQNASEAEA